MDCGVDFYSVSLEINCSLPFFFFFFFIHGAVQLCETFGQLCLQRLNGHVCSGENGSKTSQTTNQSGSLMSDSLTVKWPKESWNRDHISYCCCNVEVPERWDLEGGSNGSDILSLESRMIFIPCALSSPLPFAKQQINQEHKMSVYLPFPPTLWLAFEDSAGLQSCLNNAFFQPLFPWHGRACGLALRAEKNVCEPGWVNHRLQALGNLDPVTVIQATAERVCCQWLSWQSLL